MTLRELEQHGHTSQAQHAGQGPCVAHLTFESVSDCSLGKMVPAFSRGRYPRWTNKGTSFQNLKFSFGINGKPDPFICNLFEVAFDGRAFCGARHVSKPFRLCVGCFNQFENGGHGTANTGRASEFDGARVPGFQIVNSCSEKPSPGRDASLHHSARVLLPLSWYLSRSRGGVESRHAADWWRSPGSTELSSLKAGMAPANEAGRIAGVAPGPRDSIPPVPSRNQLGGWPQTQRTTSRRLSALGEARNSLPSEHNRQSQQHHAQRKQGEHEVGARGEAVGGCHLENQEALALHPAERAVPLLASVSCRGNLSCRVFTRLRGPNKLKSSARSCKAMHVCAVRISANIASSYGRPRRLSILRLQSGAQQGLRPTSFQASARHPTNQCSWSSTKSLHGEA